MNLDEFYSLIPVGRENRITRARLESATGWADRKVRESIEILRSADNGDGFVILSSSGQKGYWKSNDPSEIREFYGEAKRRIISEWSKLRKATRILGEKDQMHLVFAQREWRIRVRRGNETPTWLRRNTGDLVVLRSQGDADSVVGQLWASGGYNLVESVEVVG